MRKLITVLLSVLLIAGLFTGCNGDATSALVNNSVDTTITMSLGNVDFLNELKDAVNAKTISLYWYVLGTKPGSDENDKLLEITEKFSFDNPTFSREVSFEADNPAMFGLAIDEPDTEPMPADAIDNFNAWMASKVGKELPVSWKITGHKINESGTENLKIEKITEKYLIKYKKLNEETLRMTDDDSDTQQPELVDLDSYMVQPVAVKIGHSSVSKYSEGSRGTDEAPIEIKAPEDRYLWGGESLYKKLIDDDYSPETTQKENFIDRFSTRTMDNVFIFEDGTDGSALAAAAEAGKLIIVFPSANLEKFINYVTSGEGERAPYSYIPYGYDLSELDTKEFYLYFAMKEIDKEKNIWDTYYSYSDFSLWDDVIGKPTDEEVRKSMIVDFQNEIDDYASFVKGEHATLSGSRDVKKALENELSATHIRYKMYHNNKKASTEKTEHNLFITSSSKTDKPLLAKYEWTYIRNGFQSKYTFHLTRETSNPNDGYGWRVSSSRDITLWVIHNVPKSEHLYVIKDQPDYDFHSVFISNPVYFDENKPMIPIEQMICNDRGDWAYYGGGSSGSTVAKGLEWYGDSGWIETRVYFTDNVSRNNSYAFGNMTPVTTQTVVTKTDSINFGLKGGIGGEYSWQGGINEGFKFNGHLEGSFGISHTTSENIPEVTVFYAGNTGDNDPVLRWRYAVRDDFRCSFSPARYAGSKYSHAPSNTSISNLRPPASMYTISVADAYVNKVGLKFNSGFRLKRKAFKAGAEVCVGYTSAESEASCVLPYDKDPAHYGGKLPW